MNRVKRIIYILLGSVFLLLGTVGIFVPVLPTTPFWLLTCWFYLHSSETLYNRVMENRRFGSYVKGFLVDKAISLRSKIISIIVMWVSILFSMIFIKFLWVKIVLAIITVGVTAYILSFPTKKRI